MLMYNFFYFGEVIKEFCFDFFGLMVIVVVKVLGVSCKILSVILNGKVGISLEMVIRFFIVFDIFVESWLI